MKFVATFNEAGKVLKFRITLYSLNDSTDYNSGRL